MGADQRNDIAQVQSLDDAGEDPAVDEPSYEEYIGDTDSTCDTYEQ